MSSEFTKHFGNTSEILGCIMGGWNSKLPMEILQEKHPSRPFKFYQKTKDSWVVPLGFLLPSKLSLRDDRWSSSRLWWVSGMDLHFPIPTVEWSKSGVQKKTVWGSLVLFNLIIYDRFGFHTSISEPSTVRVTHWNVRPWTRSVPGDPILRELSGCFPGDVPSTSAAGRSESWTIPERR